MKSEVYPCMKKALGSCESKNSSNYSLLKARVQQLEYCDSRGIIHFYPYRIVHVGDLNDLCDFLKTCINYEII